MTPPSAPHRHHMYIDYVSYTYCTGNVSYTYTNYDRIYRLSKIAAVSSGVTCVTRNSKGLQENESLLGGRLPLSFCVRRGAYGVGCVGSDCRARGSTSSAEMADLILSQLSKVQAGDLDHIKITI